MPRFARSILALALLLLVTGCLGGTDPGDVGPLDESGEDGAAEGGGNAEPRGGDGDAGAAARDDDVDAAPDAVADPPVVVLVTNGSISALGVGAEADAVGTVCCIGLLRSGENIDGTFVPGANLTGVVVELVWEDATADLDLALRAPDYESLSPPEVNGTGVHGSRGHSWWNYEGQAGAPDGPVVIRVTDEAALGLEGEWAWNVRGKFAQSTPFTMYVSLFHGPVPAEDYSAVPV